jgi:hypothetical protein
MELCIGKIGGGYAKLQELGGAVVSQTYDL